MKNMETSVSNSVPKQTLYTSTHCGDFSCKNRFVFFANSSSANSFWASAWNSYWVHTFDGSDGIVCAIEVPSSGTAWNVLQ